VVSLIAITNAMVDTLKAIPELVALLEGGLATNIVGYIDVNPTRNSMSNAVYQMPAGSLLVVWNGTTLESGEMAAWYHVLQIYVRARRGDSALAIIDALVDGIPIPGDGLRWRYCPIMDGLLPTEVRDVARLIDEEGIDYFAVTTFTQETGDTP
jgi:hypothetical protein